MANHLALQDLDGAARAADGALAAVAAADCAPCGFTFTRVLAALAYGEVGRYRDGLAALAGVEVEGPAGELVQRLKERLARGVAEGEPEGLAPPPVEPGRTLTAILMLGRGPYRVRGELAVSGSETIAWPVILPRGPQKVTWAIFEDDEPVVSVELTDVEELATASLRDVGEKLVAAGGDRSTGAVPDLRHWGTLPAALLLLELEPPPEMEQVDLVYRSPDGLEIDRETIALPPDWTGGRIFLTRRMP